MLITGNAGYKRYTLKPMERGREDALKVKGGVMLMWIYEAGLATFLCA